MIKGIRTILLTALLFCGSTPIIKACCAGDIMNTIRKLQELRPQTTIARVRIDSSWQSRQGAFMSRAKTLEHFYGEALPSTFILATGLLNSSIVGTRTRNQDEYLIYTYFSFKGQKVFGALGGCDVHSLGPLLPADPQPCEEDDEYNAWSRLDVVQAYLSDVKNRRTGKVAYRLCNGKLVAKGRLKEGVPVGRWLYYSRYSEVSDEENDFDATGKVTAYRKYSIGEVGRRYLVEHKFVLKDTTTIVHAAYSTGKLQDSTRTVKGSDAWGSIESFGPYNELGEHSMIRRFLTFEIPGQQSSQMFHGEFIETDEAGRVLLGGEYFYGAKVGPWIEQSTDGKRSCGSKSTAEKAVTNYYPFPDTIGVDMRWGFFKNGQPVGKTYLAPADSAVCILKYREDGTTYSLQTICGDESEFKMYDKKGRLISHEISAYSPIRVGTSTHYGYTSEGIQYVQSIRKFKNRKLVGISKTWSAQNELSQDWRYDSLGRRHGSMKSYRKGKLVSEGNYEHGVPVGVHVTYHRNGKLENRIVFSENSNVVDIYEFDEEGEEYAHQRVYRLHSSERRRPYEVVSGKPKMVLFGMMDWGDE